MDNSNQRGAMAVEEKLQSALESVDVADEIVLKLAAGAGFPEEDLHRISMAVRECVANAVVHGNRYNANKTVGFGVAYSEGELRIEVSDQGAGFDASNVPDPLAEENLLRTSGRGIFIMRSLMDEMRVTAAEGGGTTVFLMKKLAREA